MNLHIVPDNVFANKFYENLAELSLLANNRMVVRTNERELRFIRHDLPFARLYSPGFRSLCGNTESYEKVYIHQFTPLLYRWVATGAFREVNWMVWGADLYNLPGVEMDMYEKLTLRKYVNRVRTLSDIPYHLKVLLLHRRYRAPAYRKVRHVLTWMKGEYDFATSRLPGLDAAHQFFFYENQLPYSALDGINPSETPRESGGAPTYILGNSATPELNHLDAVARIHQTGLAANLRIPVSYGDKRYAAFLKKNLSFYKGGQIEFIDRYMPIEEYLRMLHQSDGLIMNNVRPQGYGNIFMMMYLGKKIFLNAKNFSGKDLNENGMVWLPLDGIGKEVAIDWRQNKSAILNLFSHQALLNAYAGLFS